MMVLRSTLLLLGLLLAAKAVNIKITESAPNAGPNAAYSLQVAYLDNPIGIDVPNPRFSWFVSHSARAQSQSAFQLQVATASSFGSAVIWDTGKVVSSNFNVIYAGPALKSDTSYFWQVTWWDASNSQASWSQAKFDTGHLSQSDWTGKWIGGQNNLYRKQFSLSAAPSRARAFISGLGYYELYLNGHRVGNNRLDVGWTTYNVRDLYNVYDVTPLLLNGNNTVGVMLGHGWYASQESREPNGPLSLMFQLSVDGSIPVVSDSTWFTSPGPITYDGIYNGETYDARLEQAGWDTNDFKQGPGWAQAGFVQAPGGILSYQDIPPVTINANLTAKNMTEPGNNTYVIDFGQNFSGFCLLNITGAAGTTVTLRHAEVLMHDGSGNIYTDNLRTARATDTYILSGNSNGELYMPHFTYHGFRYVQFSSDPPIVPTLDTLLGMHIYSAIPQTGSISFTSSSPTLNQIQHNIIWGQRSNLMSVPTDCDQRDERKGWMADGQLSAEEAFHNFYMPGFYQHWAQLMVDEQGADGTLTDTVPFTFGGRPADPAWGTAYPSILYWLWKYHDDIDVLAKHYNHVKMYINYLTAAVTKTGMSNMFASYGDWVPPPPAPKCSTGLTSSFSYLNNLMQFVEMANALNNTADVATYNTLIQSMSSEYNSAFLSNSNYASGLQTCNAVSLFLGITPESDIQNVTVNLLNNIVMAPQNTHLTTGIIGTKYLMEVLHMVGRDDIALQLAENVDYPSWGWMINNAIEPATTLWELWDTPNEGPGMNSRNHIMFGSVGAWFYKALAGIDLAYQKSNRNYKDVSIAPSVVGDLRGVNASFLTGQGLITSEWSLSGGSRVCARAAEGKDFTLDCGSIGSDGVITEIQFASFGTPRGACGNYGIDDTCHSDTSKSFIEQACVGKASCTLQANEANFGNPCGAFKRVHVQAVCSKAAPSTFSLSTSIPVGASAVISLPVLDFTDITITESGTTIWANSKYQSGAAGITSASKVGSEIVVGAGSGTYSFSMTGSASSVVCVGPVLENASVNITCPQPSQVITRVQFASFGTPTGACGSFQPSDCNAGSSKYIVDSLCLSRNSCDFVAADALFGDPCYDTPKMFSVQVGCAKV